MDGLPAMSSQRRCRACHSIALHEVLDLGEQPLANSLPLLGEREQVSRFPLRLCVCQECWLLQVDHSIPPEDIFAHYTYMSSTSQAWDQHMQRFTDWAVNRFDLDSRSLVVEVASNDGYLLRHFQARGIPTLGIEPAEPAAAAAREQGIRTLVEFLDAQTASGIAADRTADLLIANNVIGHVPDLQDFIEGLATLLSPAGFLTIEIPHAGNLLTRLQFDTVYHEHFSYLTLDPLVKVLQRAGLKIEEVQALTTHGGSMRLIIRHEAVACPNSSVDAFMAHELALNLSDLSTYEKFANNVAGLRQSIRQAVTEELGRGRRIVGFGAPAKASTLLNYCDVGKDEVAYTVDSSLSKQGRAIPGVGIPIHSPSHLYSDDPDVVWVFPWNIQEEVENLLVGHGFNGELFVTQPTLGIRHARA